MTMIFQEYEDLMDIRSKILDRTEEVAKALSDINVDDGTKFIRHYNKNKAEIAINLDDIWVYPSAQDYNNFLGYCNNPLGIEDTPIEVLFSDSALDEWISKYKTLKDDHKASIENYEYNRYLELKKKFEGKDATT